MKFCNRGHVEVVYDDLWGDKGCPVCEKQNQVDDLTMKVQVLEGEIERITEDYLESESD